MSKPHYRLVRLRDCPDGARVFWIRPKSGSKLPITVITQSPRKQQTWVHVGHHFNIRAKHRVWNHFTRVWMPV